MADVHRELRELVERAGTDVVDDAQHFQALLDDYLGEQTASRGEVNLLVDTVRLGAARRLVEQVGNGAAPGPALDDQAELLARDRATGERASAAWALAAVGFALGVVDDAEVARRRAEGVRIGALSAPAAWPTMPPPAPPTAAPPTGLPPTAAPPTGLPPTGLPPTGLPPSSPPTGPPTVGPRHTPLLPAVLAEQPSSVVPPRRRIGRIVGLLSMALVLVGGGVVAAITLAGDDEPRDPGDGESTAVEVIDPDRIEGDMTEILEGLARSATVQEEFEASSWSVRDDNIVDRAPRPLSGDERLGATTWVERRQADERRYWIYVEHFAKDYVAERGDISCSDRNSTSTYCAEHTTPDGRTAYENVYALGSGRLSYYVFVPGDGAGQPEITIGESLEDGVVPDNETGKDAIPYFEIEIDAVLEALDDPRLDIPPPDDPPPLPSFQVCAYIYPAPTGYDCPAGLN